MGNKKFVFETNVKIGKTLNKIMISFTNELETLNLSLEKGYVSGAQKHAEEALQLIENLLKPSLRHAAEGDLE